MGGPIQVREGCRRRPANLGRPVYAGTRIDFYALLVREARAAAIERERGGKVEVDGICSPPETRPPAKKPPR
jgi:hypothetical protein